MPYCTLAQIDCGRGCLYPRGQNGSATPFNGIFWIHLQSIHGDSKTPIQLELLSTRWNRNKEVIRL